MNSPGVVNEHPDVQQIPGTIIMLLFKYLYL
jgi:hypothetical protein